MTSEAEQAPAPEPPHETLRRELRPFVSEVVRRDLFGLGIDSFNLDTIQVLAAAIDSSQFVSANMPAVVRFGGSIELRQHAIAQVAIEGLILEFGVFSGNSLNQFASGFPDRRVYGFDSFDGLPEDWRPGYPKGAFSTRVPDVRDNVELVIGWFDKTAPAFAAAHVGEPIALLHVDCDLYSSTRCIFDHLGRQIVPGTIIVFDEYLNYPEWRRHEHRAFEEFVASHKVTFDYISLVPAHQQVAVRIRSVGS